MWRTLLRRSSSASTKEERMLMLGTSLKDIHGHEYFFTESSNLDYQCAGAEMGHFLPGKKGILVEDGITDTPANGRKRYFTCCCSFTRICKICKFALEEWIYLALLGIIMAIITLGMDVAIAKLQEGHFALYRLLQNHQSWLAPFTVWAFYTVVVVFASALWAHFIAPQAIGSGIPEMKTVLRGIILKEYLTVRTLISKIVALSLSIGSGLPVGKEGPFVHIASIIANQLSRFVHGSTAIYENESRASELLAAGCAVGVACTFSAPVGGVLFSIEVTAVYFAVRNYWRGFFAATCSATLFSVLQNLRRGTSLTVSNWISISVAAHYQTTFPIVNTFTSTELLFFAALGLLCGLAGAIFVLFHRTFVLFLRRNKIIKAVLQKYWLIYPILIAFLIGACTYPMGAGMYLGGEQAFARTLNDFFISCSWLDETNNPYGCGSGQNFTRANWAGPKNDINIFHSLLAFQTVYFFLSIVASTLPIPAGIFMPVFVIGASIGRTAGEFLRLLYPDGVIYGVLSTRINPGMYAVAGAAAFCGAVTHTVSVAVIVFELTGQLCLLIPVMIAVLIANAVCSYLQPSIYDSIIKIKHLPYLPEISHSSSMYHSLTAERFMTSAAFVARDSTYAEVQELIYKMSHIRAFPLVENKKTMSLVGSVSRSQLYKLLQANVGVKARKAEAAHRISLAIAKVGERYNLIGDSKRKDGNAAPMGRKRASKRFNVEPVVDGSAPSTKTVEASLATLNSLLTVPAGLPELTSKSMILAMGAKRCCSSNDLDESATHHSLADVLRSITKFGKSKKEAEIDLYGDERERWEKSVLQKKVNLSSIKIEPSPFQLVHSTSLFKVHSLFSLLGLKRAYVTRDGQLVGVISLQDLRNAIESVESGVLPADGETNFHPDQPPDIIGDDTDYLHPQLEVLTRPNTCESLDDILAESPRLPRKISPPSINQSTLKENSIADKSILKSSMSAPCLDPDDNQNNKICNEPPVFILETESTDSSRQSSTSTNTGEDPGSGPQRRPPQVRIVIPDEDSLNTENLPPEKEHF
ncbi:unnamed protein product [Cylicocyclus nassatus]|uniref:Chloride channel protein n=1 Tax=Cylicocyclus nassatus TaxID=53992 RepID=A0AA36H706_CYLNA|nr:unnamed protein product [Cylicocyclus nassatus]